MAPSWRALLFVALLAGPAAALADGATLGVAWDPNPDSTVSGYRVYVGTASGQHSEFFDVGRSQASFVYTTAIDGRRYYFAVATLAAGVTSAKSEEVSGVAGQLSSSPSPSPSPQVPADFWVTYDAGRRGAANRSVLPPVAVERVASGLADVTSLAALPTGGGLLVERGTTVRAFSDQGVADAVAFEAPEGTRIAAVAADPRFAATGFVFVAEAQQTPDGGEDVFVVRHRLLGGALGESSAVAVGRHQKAGTVARLAITSAGQAILVQGEARALAWDDVRGGLWSVGLEAASTVGVSFVSSRDEVATAVNRVVQPIDVGAVSDASVAVLNGAAKVALAGPTTVFRFDVAASHLSEGTSVADRGTVVSLVSASANVDYVVVRERVAGGDDAPTFALLRVQHADPP